MKTINHPFTTARSIPSSAPSPAATPTPWRGPRCDAAAIAASSTGARRGLRNDTLGVFFEGPKMGRFFWEKNRLMMVNMVNNG